MQGTAPADAGQDVQPVVPCFGLAGGSAAGEQVQLSSPPPPLTVLVLVATPSAAPLQQTWQWRVSM